VVHPETPRFDTPLIVYRLRLTAAARRKNSSRENLTHLQYNLLDKNSSAVEARANLAGLAASLSVPFEELRGIPYIWCQRRSETEFPTREEFWTIAPAIVESKARGGLAWFDAKWSDQQMDLF
jgi:hypothetical protein